jgi:hypothetical protein
MAMSRNWAAAGVDARHRAKASIQIGFARIGFPSFYYC